jgi:sugar phosphate isomerase/epimerase
MSIRLSTGTDAFPTIPHEVTLELTARLGFAGHDLMMAGNRLSADNFTTLRLEEMLAAPRLWAGRIEERLARHGIVLSDLFASPRTDLETMSQNHPDPAERGRGHEFFECVLEFAVELGAPGITMPPGIDWPHEPHAESLARAGEELGRRAAEARDRGVRYSTEPHVGSVCETPSDVLELCALAPGLELTLDYSHFLASGFSDADVEPLVPHARHVHARGAAEGRLQTSMRENTIDFERVVDVLREQDYEGFITVEYVWVDWGGLDEVDVLAETILMRDRLQSKLDGVPWSYPALAVPPSEGADP